MAFKMKGPSLYPSIYSSPLPHKTGTPHCHPNTNPDGTPSDSAKKDMMPRDRRGGKNKKTKPAISIKKEPKTPVAPFQQTNKRTKGEGRHFRSKEEGAGMTKAGVASYKKQNPGSKLKTAVTGDVKPGSNAAKRRKSFCARSRGWTGERGKAARARWKC